jgi:hypothetical protein
MVRVRYFLRTDPPTAMDEPPRVPRDVRDRLLEGLGYRFEPSTRPYWEAIDVTSLPGRRVAGEYALINAEAHRRLGSILDEIEPRWRQFYVLIPPIRSLPTHKPQA